MWCRKTNKKYKYTERYKDLEGKYKSVSITLDKSNDKLAFSILNNKIETILNEALAVKDANYTLEQIYDKYYEYQLNIEKVKKSTIDRNKFSLNTCMKLIGPNTLVNGLTTNVIYTSLSKSQKSNCTINGYIERLGAMLRWAYKYEYTNNNIADRLVKLPEKSKKEKIKDKFLEKSEVEDLINFFKEYNLKVATMCEFMLRTGLRYGEMAALTWNDIDLNNLTLTVNKTYDSQHDLITNAKTFTSNRTIAIDMPILLLLKKYKSSYPISIDNIVFPSSNGGHYQVFNFNKHLRKAKKELGIKKQLTSHVLRHTHASLLFEQGVDYETISRRLGHCNSQITREIYVHITNTRQKTDFEYIRSICIL